MEQETVLNGGVGSGDFNHAGRPPHVGGSEPAGTGRGGKYSGGRQQWVGKKPSDTEKKQDKKEVKEQTEKQEKQKEQDNDDIKIEKTTRKSSFYDKDIEVTKLSKDDMTVEIDKYGDKEYHLRGYKNGHIYMTHDLTSEKGAMRKAKEYLGVIKPIERKPREKKPDAPLEKTDLKSAQDKYHDVIKKYNDAHNKIWGKDREKLTTKEYYEAYDQMSKAKRELTTARREYAESIMSNFVETEINPYQDKIDAKREHYADKSRELKKSSEHNWKMHEDTSLPFGQPIINPAIARAYKRTNRYFDKSIEDYNKSEYYKEKAQKYGSHGISSDDANAISRLAKKYKSGVDSAEKRRIIDRVISIYKNKEVGKTSKATESYEKLGFNVERNSDANRLQLKFDGIPDASTRSVLKSNGFRWSPSNKAWQRQLGSNAEYSLKRVVETLSDKVENCIYKHEYLEY